MAFVFGRVVSHVRTLALVAEHGTTNVSIGAICERAGFTRGAFYSNFKTVDDVFFALYEQRNAEAQHRPEVAAVLREHAEQFRRHLQPLLLHVLELTGRRPLDSAEDFTRAVITAHVGAITQSPLHDDPEAVVCGIILGLTTEQ